jgi:hypothetical protein
MLLGGWSWGAGQGLVCQQRVNAAQVLSGKTWSAISNKQVPCVCVCVCTCILVCRVTGLSADAARLMFESSVSAFASGRWPMGTGSTRGEEACKGRGAAVLHTGCVGAPA